MATEPQAPAEPMPTSAIENEIVTYRAISPMAVGALFFGVVSLLCFADLWFLIASALAVVAGLLAERNIRRMPDILTGRKLAQAGIALGLITGLASLTNSYVSEWMVRRQAAAFGKEFAEALQTKNLANAIHMRLPPSERKKITPADALKRMEDAVKDRSSFMMQVGPIQEIQRRLKSADDAHVEFVQVEGVGFDRLTPMAGLLLEIHAPAAPGHPAEEFALVEAKGDLKTRGGWFVSDVVFPYKRESYVVQPKSPGGHEGHLH